MHACVCVCLCDGATLKVFSSETSTLCTLSPSPNFPQKRHESMHGNGAHKEAIISVVSMDLN